MENKDILELFNENKTVNQTINSTSEVNMTALQQAVNFKLPKLTNEN